MNDSRRIIAAIAGLVLLAMTVFAVEFPGPVPEKASAAIKDDMLVVGNNIIRAEWAYIGKKVSNCAVTDVLSGKRMPVDCELFSINVRDGMTYKASEMTLVERPGLTDIAPDPKAPSDIKKRAGKRIKAVFMSKDGLLRVDWSVVMHDGANFITQDIGFSAAMDGVDAVTLFDQRVAGARQVGEVLGSPMLCGNIFFGYEHPCAVNEKTLFGRTRCYLNMGGQLSRGQRYEAVMLYGVVPAGQLRRGFLYYEELQRAHPGRTFLNYNSWYDIEYISKYSDAGAVDSIHACGEELYAKRNVKIDSFLFDDGWDDVNTFWKFHAGLPDGFGPAKAESARYKANVGVWLSPWGGYGSSKNSRVGAAVRLGVETNNYGPVGFGVTLKKGINHVLPVFNKEDLADDWRMALSGSKYYEMFKAVCVDMIRKYDVNLFKLDGIGMAETGVSGGRFGNDIDAVLSLGAELREERPDVFINLTTGTWPSPFWLKRVDAIWRGGGDYWFAGKAGSRRQQWITYRDSAVYHGVVKLGPLYPISSLMTHGIIYAKHTENLNVSSNNDLRCEIRSYFGSGTHLQEMYISPALMTEEDWDNLAEAAKWARRNSEVMKDVHWIGGDPLKSEVYGWAAWNRDKGLLTLRNPSRKAKSFSFDIGRIFELPEDASKQYLLISPYKDQIRTGIKIEAGVSLTIDLDPFEVIVFDAMPK